MHKDAWALLSFVCLVGVLPANSRRGGLVVELWIPEREVGGFGPLSGRRVVSLSKIHLHVPPQKVLVIPRKWLLHPNMTEKLLTWM